MIIFGNEIPKWEKKKINLLWSKLKWNAQILEIHIRPFDNIKLMNIVCFVVPRLVWCDVDRCFLSTFVSHLIYFSLSLYTRMWMLWVCEMYVCTRFSVLLWWCWRWCCYRCCCCCWCWWCCWFHCSCHGLPQHSTTLCSVLCAVFCLYSIRIRYFVHVWFGVAWRGRLLQQRK